MQFLPADTHAFAHIPKAKFCSSCLWAQDVCHTCKLEPPNTVLITSMLVKLCRSNGANVCGRSMPTLLKKQ